MNISRKLLAIVGVAVIACAGYTPNPDAATTEVTQRITLFSTSPLPATLPLNQAQQLQQGTTMPLTATPDGYHLIGRRVSNCVNGKCYTYTSDRGYYTDEECVGARCTLRAQLYASFKENVVGGSSKRWILTTYGGVVSNPSAESWRFDLTYYCGVNVSGASDHICGNGASPSGVTATMYNNNFFYETFEKVNGNIVFPMMNMQAVFEGNWSQDGRFRGWDTCNRATSTALCSSTGDGY